MSSPAQPTKASVVTAFRRTQILQAARDRFTRHGVADTTVDDIAKAARVAKGTVYLYYKSKDEVLRQILEADLEALVGDTLPSIAGGGTLAARLERFFAATLTFFERNREFIEHCQLEMTPDVRKKVRASLGRCYQDQVEAWEQVLANEAAAGAVDRAALAGAAWSIVSLARGLSLHRLAGWTTEPIETAAARASALIVKGLATR